MKIKINRSEVKFKPIRYFNAFKPSLLPFMMLLITFSTQAQFSQLDESSDSVVNQTVNEFMTDHEIVGATICLIDSGKILGEIDIDSNQPSFFKDDDRIMLEQIAELIVDRLKDIR